MKGKILVIGFLFFGFCVDFSECKGAILRRIGSAVSMVNEQKNLVDIEVGRVRAITSKKSIVDELTSRLKNADKVIVEKDIELENLKYEIKVINANLKAEKERSDLLGAQLMKMVERLNVVVSENAKGIISDTVGVDGINYSIEKHMDVFELLELFIKQYNQLEKRLIIVQNRCETKSDGFVYCVIESLKSKICFARDKFYSLCGFFCRKHNIEL